MKERRVFKEEKKVQETNEVKEVKKAKDLKADKGGKEISITIGKRIQLLRKKYNYSQDELANLLNISRPKLSKIENDIKDIPIPDICEICNIFNITADYLLFGKQNTNIDFEALLSDFSYIEQHKIVESLKAILKIYKE